MFPLSLYFSDQQVKWSVAQLWNNIPAYYCADEEELITQLAELSPKHNEPPLQLTDNPFSGHTVTLQLENTFAIRGGIRDEERLVLLSLAEHLLHLPNQQSISHQIDTRLSTTHWPTYFAHNRADIQRTSLWQQGITAKRVTLETDAAVIFSELVERIDFAIIHDALTQAVKALREQIIFSPDIHQGLQRMNNRSDKLTCDFNILGENAVSAEAARQHFNHCLDAIKAIAVQHAEERPTPSLSIKLSALHPRFEPLKSASVIEELTQRMLHLLIIARSENISLMIEAEESSRQELTLQVFEKLLRSDLCRGWGGLGITVQAYSKRAMPILGWLSFIADERQTSIPVRLVKGSYRDGDITQADIQGLPGYPVYTQKQATDLSYQLCARYLLSDHCPLLAPQFASHDNPTIEQVIAIAEQSNKTVELQRQQGSEETLFSGVRVHNRPVQQRLYAPLGEQPQLPAYLTRRLGESAADSDAVIHQSISNKRPTGVILDSQLQRQRLLDKIAAFGDKQWLAAPLINGEPVRSRPAEITVSPFNLSLQTGELFRSTIEDVREAYTVTRAGFIRWNKQPVAERAMIINRFADLLEQHREELVALSIREAGKTLRDALNEIRETVDLCHIYAEQAVSQLSPQPIVSLAGAADTLIHQGRGIFMCISPWSFPLATWTGQVVAALLAGNVVIAKPANSTPLIAYRAAELLLEAGVASDALALLPGSSDEIDEPLIKDFRLCGIAFTGSNFSANIIARQLAHRENAPTVPFITATGGLSAMIVDSSVPPEQVVRDVIESAFNSAGQRCSALRVLYLQEDIADPIETMLIEAIHTLKIGDPREPDTDLGPVIDNHALQAQHGHIEHCRAHGRLLFEGELSHQHDTGYFVAPTLIRLHSIDELSGEYFGPILHIIRYQKDNPERIAEEINRSEYGLSLHIHSSDNEAINALCQQLRPGNISIRRNLNDSFCRWPRFASSGLSGTGPKAGGPNYLLSFTQQTMCS
ncbi:L-glutamate gamma-semialdehyde dehydrogenase [uncultured Amphritea sp.]|uniref:L-glutamate gamma-semialdehyde dehydrogenase n=1 Tax=uncultured Amphritea sp. TaxID=981605 RepID=UPI002625E146|nr:L-glutamate gamma-semialdehyde dehydrogenase [uncultured Amphritea sp.]